MDDFFNRKGTTMVIHFCDGGYAECYEIDIVGDNIYWDGCRYFPLCDVEWIEDDDGSDVTQDYLSGTAYGCTNCSTDIKASSDEDQTRKLSRYLGANLLEKYTAFLNVYGAEESDEFDFEESFDGSLADCLDHLVKYQKIIDDNGLDAYLSLESWSSYGRNFEGDLVHILDDLLAEGYITQEGYDYYYYGGGNDGEVIINSSTKPKYMADMVTASYGPESEDGYEYLVEEDDEDYTYYVAGYYDNLMRGLGEDLFTDSFDAVLSFANELANNGYFIKIKNLQTGSEVYYDASVWLDAIDKGDVPEDVYEVTM